MPARAVPPPAILLVAALLLAAASTPVCADALCAPRDADGAFVARGAELRAWPGSEVLWTAPADAGTVFSLACDGTRVVAGLAREDGRGRVVVLQRGASGWTPGAEIALRGVPAAIALAGETVAIVVRERRRAMLGFVGTAGGRLEERELQAMPKALAASPDGASFLVALDDELKTFRATDGGTWLVYDLAGAATALAARSGVPRVLVARAGALEALDLRDVPVRGVLPVRETATLAPVALWAAWADNEGRIAAVLLERGPAIAFLAGEDLRELARVALPELPSAIVALDDGRVLWLDGKGEARVAAAAAGALAGAKTPRFAPLPAPASAVAEEPAAATKTEPPAADAKTEPPPAPPPPATQPAPPAQPEPEARPPATRPAPPAPPPPPARPAPAPAPVPPAPAPAVENGPAAGTIAGLLRGQTGLVAEILIAGPDNITRVAARVAPDRGTFRATGLAPGTYRVTPMGAKGATLRASPACATVTLTAGSGARADFQVVGAW